MSTRAQKWIYGMGSAFIGGGASAVTSGLTSMGFAPDKFNLSSLSGFGHVAALSLANFMVSGGLSVMFYLRQSPLPAESTGQTEMISKAGGTNE